MRRFMIYDLAVHYIIELYDIWYGVVGMESI